MTGRQERLGRSRSRSYWTGARWRKRMAEPVAGTAIYLLLLALFGGGDVDWTPAYMLLCFATLVAAGLVAWRTCFASLDIVPVLGRVALFGIAALPLLQLVPLPPGLWQALPGQELRQATLGMMGLAGSWQPLTLDPLATALAAVLAVGFVALMALLLRLDDVGFARILDIALSVVLFGILLGILQVVSDGRFPHLHPVNTGAVMLGVYANKNHMALAIACAMALAGFVTSRRIGNPVRRRLIVIGMLIFGLVCLVTTNSRAGLILGMVGAAIVLADVVRAVPWRYRLSALAGLTVMAVMLLTSQVFQLLWKRFGDVDGDLRWRFLNWSMPLVRTYAWTGSGAGSFKALFIPQEQLGWVKPTIVNAVHNDYVQLVIEFGGPGVAILLLLAGSLLGSIPSVRRLPSGPHRAEMLFGSVAVLMIALHSIIDYPLRRPAVWIFFALALAAIYRGHAAAKAATWKAT